MIIRKLIQLLLVIYAAWSLLTYKPRKFLRLYEPPTHYTRYTLLLDTGAVKSLERLRRTYGLRNWAEVYDLAVQVLNFSTSSIAEGWNAPARRNPSTGLIQHAELPPVNPSAWQRSA